MEVADQVLERPEEEKDVPIEDTIREAIRSATPAPDPVIATDAAPDRARDESGKFAATERVKATPAEVGINPVQPALGVEKPAEVVAPATASKPLPDWMGWKGEARAKFNELPDWAKSEVLRREEDAHRAITKHDDERNFGRKVHEIVSPYLPTIRAEGGTPEKAIESLLQTAHVLRAGTPFQKAQALHTVAQQFNVDLSLPLQQGAQNPQIAQLERQLAEVQGQLQGFTQQRQIQETQSLQSQIEEFKSKPGHEHFDKVRTVMGALIDNGIATTLDDAYDRAVYADPEIRSSLVASQAQAESEKRRIAAQTAAEAAKRAGGSVSGGPGVTRALNGSGAEVPLEETIRAAIRESSGRV